VYYRTSLDKPKPAHTRAPTKTEQETGWMRATHALVSGDPKACLSILDAGPAGGGPAVHIEVDADVVVTLLPDDCGLAVLRAEALDRLDDQAGALALVDEAAKQGCHVAEVVATELRNEER
jgi:hypothetical protein